MPRNMFSGGGGSRYGSAVAAKPPKPPPQKKQVAAPKAKISESAAALADRKNQTAILGRE